MSVPEFQSKRVKKRSKDNLSQDRYKYLSLDQAEPDLGDPLVGPSSVGAKPFPNVGQAFILASFSGTGLDTNRYWVPPSSLTGLGLGLVPGAMTIQDEGSLVGAANSFTVLNFVGDGIAVDPVSFAATEQTGIATIRMTSPGYGNIGEFQYKASNGLLGGVSDFRYNPTSGNVGFGTTLATSKLHVVGDVTVDRLFARQELSGSFILPSGENLNNFSIIGKLRSNYINVNRIDATDLTGINTSFINNLNSSRINATNVNVSGITTLQTSNITSLSVTNQNTTGIATFNSILGSFSFVGVSTIGVATVLSANIGVASITNLISTIQRTGLISATNASIGVATVGFITATNGYVGIITGNSLNYSVENIGLSSIGIATIGFSSITNSFIGVATITTLNVTNLSAQLGGNGTVSFGNVSVANTLSSLSIGSTFIQASHIGIGTTAKTAYRLDINGDTRFNGLLYAANGRGSSGEVLTSQGASPPLWAPAENVTVGAANSVLFSDTDANINYYLNFSSKVGDVGFINVDSESLVYNAFTNSVGIGSTIPAFNLDVVGNINFTGTLYQNGDLYVASRWGIDESQNIYRVNGNVGIGTSVLDSNKFTVKGNSLFNGKVIVGTGSSIGIGSETPRSKLDVLGDSRFIGTSHLEGSITERVSSATGFNSEYPVSSGVLAIDASNSTIAVGILTTSVTTWAFSGISTENNKAVTITLLIDSSSLITYGDQCTVNGKSISGGVKWNGGIAPSPTDNDDVLSFAVITDRNGVVRVYGSSSLNFS